MVGSTQAAGTSHSTTILNCNKILTPKERRHRKTKLARENLKLKREIESLKRSKEKYRKRAFRCQNRVNLTPNKVNLTPKSQTNIMVKQCLKGKQKDVRKKVARQLFMHTTLLQSLRKSYSSSSSKTKRVLRFTIASHIVKKYKCMQELGFKSLGLKGRLVCGRKAIAHAKKIHNVKKIQDFFYRDDVSRATAGKKETVTKKQDKKQKRYLLDTLYNLHRRYINEEGEKCSYSTFAKYRPFNVVFPKIDDRNTCLCLQHSNIQHKSMALFKKGIIDCADPEKLAKDTVCKSTSKFCMYDECKNCITKIVPIQRVLDNNMIVEWPEWVRKKEQIVKKLDEQETVKTITKVVKETKKNKIGELVNVFQKDIRVFKKHIFNIHQQYNAYRTCLNNLEEDEAALHIDFSENFNCKMGEEVQSHHFGGSRKQVCLHTGVLYLKLQERPITFCSISSSLEHDPAAIWAHLEPVLKMVRDNYKINIVHFFSDGPFNQYKQKKNFYLFNKYVEKFKFQWCTWNFFESGHGKGAADGVGGMLKRVADRIISCGGDIADADDFFRQLKDKTKVKLYLISESEIDKIRKAIPNKIPVLKGTLSVHQMVTTGNGIFRYRSVSCFCKKNDELCPCFETKVYNCQIKPDLASHKKIEDVKSVEAIPPVLKGTSAVYPCLKNQIIKTRYSDIYSSTSSEVSSDEDQIVGKEVTESNIKVGTYMLVKFKAAGRRNSVYRYAVVAQNDIEEDGEVKVMTLSAINNERKIYKTVDDDISYIHFDQILKILPEPMFKFNGGRLYYEFPVAIDVFQKS